MPGEHAIQVGDRGWGLEEVAVRRSALVRPRVIGAALVLSLVGSIGAAAPQVAVAADDDHVLERADVTYRLARTKARVEVTAKVSYTNQIPNKGRTRYYIEVGGPIVVPTYARDFSVSGRGVRAHLETTQNGYRVYSFSFPRIFKGDHVSFTARWVLPSRGGESSNPTRVTRAYSHLCWTGQPVDVGTVGLVLPRGLSVQTLGEPVRSTTAKEVRRSEARTHQDIAAFGACSDVYDHARLERSAFTSPSGTTVALNAWPGDEAWLALAQLNVGLAVGRLEGMMGSKLPADRDVRVYEAARNAMSGYAGDYNPGTSIIRINEGVPDITLVAHELAHAWFNPETVDRPWMWEGLAEWSAVAANGYRCSVPVARPGDPPRLSRWHVLGYDPTDDDKALVGYQYAAACTLMQSVADRIGRDRMRDVIRALLDGEAAYDGVAMTASSARRDGPATWRDWLDAVDERGMLPAGVTDAAYAQGLLVQAGITTDERLVGRTEARQALAELRAITPGGITPQVVRKLMGAWDFERARVAIDVATEVARLIAASPPLGDKDGMWARFEGASRTNALRGMKTELSGT